MTIDEFNEHIKDIHEKLNDAFIAVQAMPVDYKFADKKVAAKDSIISARRSLDAAGLAYTAIG